MTSVESELRSLSSAITSGAKMLADKISELTAAQNQYTEALQQELIEEEPEDDTRVAYLNGPTRLIDKVEHDERVFRSPLDKIEIVVKELKTLMPSSEIVQFKCGINQINVDISLAELEAMCQRLRNIE